MIGIKAVQLLFLCQVVQQITAVCPMIKCAAECYKSKDDYGCPKCKCDNTCLTTTCPEGQHCVMVTDRCLEPPCPQRPECVPDDEPKTCPRAIVCKKPCVADIGEDGCYSKCTCPKTCQDIKCKADEVCELVTKFCPFVPPCVVVPTCVPKNRTCSQSPNANHCLDRDRYLTRWTYNSDTNTCESFRYYGCNPSPNTFNSPKQCTDTCVQTSTCPPNAKLCMENCYLGKKTPESCSECICPCQTMECKEGYECRLQKRDCRKIKPCYPTAYCVPIPATTCGPVCDVFCEYGNVKDENGCDTCKCKSAPTTPGYGAEPV